MSEKLAQQLRYDFFYQMMNKDIPFFDENRTGEILSRMSSDVAVIQDGLSTNISMVLRSTVTVVASLVIMSYISW